MSSKEEIIGFHKGSLNTLMKEYNELSKMINIVGSFIGYHKNELEKLGIKIQVNKNQNNSNDKKTEEKNNQREEFQENQNSQKSNMDFYSKLDNL